MRKRQPCPWPGPLSVSVTGGVWYRACNTDPVSHLTPPPHTLKGPGCALDGPYDEPDRPKGPF